MTSISKEQLCKLMEWKLTRGKMRPLMRFITALDEEKVKRVIIFGSCVGSFFTSCFFLFSI